MSENKLAGIAKVTVASRIDEGWLVEQAAGWAGDLVQHRKRWHGEKTDVATYEVARKLKLDAKVFKALRYSYRWPKHIAAGAYLKLLLAAEQIKSIDERLNSEVILAEADGINAENSAAYRFSLAVRNAPVAEAPELNARRRG